MSDLVPENIEEWTSASKKVTAGASTGSVAGIVFLVGALLVGDIDKQQSPKLWLCSVSAVIAAAIFAVWLLPIWVSLGVQLRARGFVKSLLVFHPAKVLSSAVVAFYNTRADDVGIEIGISNHGVLDITCRLVLLEISHDRAAWERISLTTPQSATIVPGGVASFAADAKRHPWMSHNVAVRWRIEAYTNRHGPSTASIVDFSTSPRCRLASH